MSTSTEPLSRKKNDSSLIVETDEEKDVLPPINEIVTQETNESTQTSEIDNDNSTVFMPLPVEPKYKNDPKYANEAVLQYIGYNADFNDIYPTSEERFFKWKNALNDCFPNDMVLGFPDPTNFTNLSSQNIDNLKVAIVTRISGKSFQPMVLTKLQSQCSKNNKLVELYYPASVNNRCSIDLNKDNICVQWNSDYAAFNPNIAIGVTNHDLVTNKGKIICNLFSF